jgi:uncharacterized iron-regulated membrane protein
LLLLFAWSSVGFNLPQVYNPIMAAIAGPDSRREGAAIPARSEPDWEAARQQGARLLQQAEREQGFRLERMEWLRLDREAGLWIIGFRSDREIQQRFAGGRLAYSVHDGRLQYLTLPTGQSGRGTFETWLFGLHMGIVLGTPWRIAVTLIGLGLTLVAATGVLIWTRKRTSAFGRSPAGSVSATLVGRPLGATLRH